MFQKIASEENVEEVRYHLKENALMTPNVQQNMVSFAFILDERRWLEDISLSLNSFLFGHKC